MSFLESERVQDLLARAGLERLPPRARVGVACAVALVLAVAVWRFWPAAPAPEIAFDEVAEAGETEATRSEETSEAIPAVAVVHVAGAVLRPGVYALPLGGRVSDAIAAAGGALGSAAADAVNLARMVADGERIYIPTQEEVAGAVQGVGSAGSWSGEAPSSAVGADGLIDINRATVTELEELPGVGPATAQKIVDDREANGPFTKPEDLMRVPGIGAKKFEAMREQVSVG
ncbi:MAG: helix-hairpin-helix domain-containing protein [Coriobacteriia bacterium]|nr:helix-hairpin-helix domain-containing protein [Coriobacteriia bacterium]